MQAFEWVVGIVGSLTGAVIIFYLRSISSDVKEFARKLDGKTDETICKERRQKFCDQDKKLLSSLNSHSHEGLPHESGVVIRGFTIIAVVLIALLCYGSAQADNLDKIHTPKIHVGKKTLLSGVMANTTSTAYDVAGFSRFQFDVILTGTANVILQTSSDGGATWIDQYTVSSAGKTSQAFPFLCADQVRAEVSGCSSCTVSVTVFGGVK